MRKLLFAAGALVLAVGAAASSARADGPRASSEHNWPGMRAPAIGAVAVPVEFNGPRPSSENNWPGVRAAASGAVPATAQAASAAAPQYVWHEGYDHGGKWHGHWTMVR